MVVQPAVVHAIFGPVVAPIAVHAAHLVVMNAVFRTAVTVVLIVLPLAVTMVVVSSVQVGSVGGGIQIVDGPTCGMAVKGTTVVFPVEDPSGVCLT